MAGFPASLHSLNRFIPAHFGHQSDRIRTPFRTQSDSIPKQLGHHSDGAPKTVRFPPEHCPDSVGTVSGLHRNTVRLHVGTLSDLRRNTQQRAPDVEFPKTDVMRHIPLLDQQTRNQETAENKKSVDPDESKCVSNNSVVNQNDKAARRERFHRLTLFGDEKRRPDWIATALLSRLAEAAQLMRWITLQSFIWRALKPCGFAMTPLHCNRTAL